MLSIKVHYAMATSIEGDNLLALRVGLHMLNIKEAMILKNLLSNLTKHRTSHLPQTLLLSTLQVHNWTSRILYCFVIFSRRLDPWMNSN